MPDAIFMLGNEVSKTFWGQVLQPVFGSSDANEDMWNRAGRGRK